MMADGEKVDGWMMVAAAGANLSSGVPAQASEIALSSFRPGRWISLETF